MPLYDEYARLPLTAIRVDRAVRQRQKLEIDSLKSSIAARGVMNPIIVRRDGTLIAGERRLEASRALGLADIPVRFADELSATEGQIIELEENLKRKDLHWTELVAGINTIHELYVQQAPDWNIAATAEALGMHEEHIRRCIRVAKKIITERMEGGGISATAECHTIMQASERINRAKQRAAADAIDALLGDDPPTGAEAGGDIGDDGDDDGLGLGLGPVSSTIGSTGIPKIGPPQIRLDGPAVAAPRSTNAAPRPAPEAILNEDFAEWAQYYAGPKFNFLHCDFPYGVDLFKPGSRILRNAAKTTDFEYNDKREVFDKLLDALFANAKNILSNSCHIMFWCPAKQERISELLGLFATGLPQFTFWPYPLIWHKSDNAGMFPSPDMGPRHTYEVALFGHSGGRKIVQMVADSHSGPTNNTIHPSAKPTPMLKHFFRMLVDGSTRMLDPTCGSGTSVVMADELSAQSVLGLEIDPTMANSAKLALREARQKRAAAAKPQGRVDI